MQQWKNSFVALALGLASFAVAAQEALSEGEIRKVDKDAGKLTIRHGELKNLGMGAMTMVFRVKDAAMLGQVQAGDKVAFLAEKLEGQYTVVKLEKKEMKGAGQ